MFFLSVGRTKDDMVVGCKRARPIGTLQTNEMKPAGGGSWMALFSNDLFKERTSY